LEEEAVKKCLNCGAGLKTTRGIHRYTESGLPNITLVNVEIRECPDCGEREVVIPRMEQLHRTIAHAISRQTQPLKPEEVRFLRKWLGYSTTDFALVMGVRPETVSRWESQTAGKGYRIPPTAERLLRLLVANQEPAAQYPIDLFTTQPRVRPQPLKLKLRAPDWRDAA
jgi:putative zinc finger/helix-turn-helix YgiT family protein